MRSGPGSPILNTPPKYGIRHPVCYRVDSLLVDYYLDLPSTRHYKNAMKPNHMNNPIREQPSSLILMNPFLLVLQRHQKLPIARGFVTLRKTWAIRELDAYHQLDPVSTTTIHDHWS